jgi:N-acetylmuramoyl-L-alanine amidase
MTGPVILPELAWVPTEAKSSRQGHAVDVIFVHVWGVRFTNLAAEARSYQGVINEFRNPKNDASAHVVYPGSSVPGRATQMVPWSMLAWTEMADNKRGISIESADAIWQGHDPAGFHQLARIVAFLVHDQHLPCVWSIERGFARHGDGGSRDGGHTSCPTANLSLWRSFAALVEFEYHRGGFRPAWGRS